MSYEYAGYDESLMVHRINDEKGNVVAEVPETVSGDGSTRAKDLLLKISYHEKLVKMVKSLDDLFILRHGCFPIDRVTPDQVKFNHVMSKARDLIEELESTK